MNAKLLIVSMVLLCCLLLLGCGEDTDSDEGGYAPAEEEFGGFIIVLQEEGGVTNKWTFTGKGAKGQATLEGVGDFSYTYEKTGDNTSVLTFDVDGEDRYEMKWTSDTGGTFEESFEGEPGSSGKFTIE